jgi:hypothetical protein
MEDRVLRERDLAEREETWRLDWEKLQARGRL